MGRALAIEFRYPSSSADAQREQLVRRLAAEDTRDTCGIPIVIMILVFQRRIGAGLTAGAVKG